MIFFTSIFNIFRLVSFVSFVLFLFLRSFACTPGQKVRPRTTGTPLGRLSRLNLRNPLQHEPFPTLLRYSCGPSNTLQILLVAV